MIPGGGYGGKGFKGAKGGGKASHNWTEIKDPSKTVWVGNIPEGSTYQDLLQLAKSLTSGVKWADVLKKNTGAVGFASPAEAQAGALALKGADLNGAALDASPWKGQGSAGSKGMKGGFGKGFGNQGKGLNQGLAGLLAGGGVAALLQQPGVLQAVLQQAGGAGLGLGKGMGKGMGKGKVKGKANKIQNPEKTLWVGNLAPGTTYQEVLTLAKACGNAKWADIRGTTAAVGFASEDEIPTAIAGMNGAEIKGSTIIADKWERKTPGAPAAS